MRGKHKSRFFLGFILLFILIMGFIPSRYVFAQADIEYTFEQDVLFESDNPTIDKTFNLRSMGEFTDIYNATYSFTNEIDGTNSTDIGFVDNDISNGAVTSQIIASFDGHGKVLELFDNDGAGRVFVRNSFDSGQISGTIEFWIETTDVTKLSRAIGFNQGGGTGFELRIDLSKFQWVAGGVNDVGLGAVNNIFYHIKLVFNCTSDTFEIWINGIQFQTAAGFAAASITIDRFAFLTDVGDSGYTTYIDAIGYSWDSGFDFESDIIGNVPDNWLPFPNPPLTSTTVENAFGSQVLQLNDSDVTDLFDIETFFPQGINQTIEFDVAVNTTTENNTLDIAFLEGGTLLFRFRIDNDDLSYNIVGGSFIPLKESFIIVNTVFRIKIVLNDDDDTFDVYIDGDLEVSDLSYREAPTISANYMFLLSGLSTLCITYVDNFTFSSTTPYSIGLNLVPFIETDTTLLEVDRFEFAYDGKEDPNVLYAIGEDDVGRWVDREDGGGDKVNIQFKPSEPKDRVIQMIDDQETLGRGIEYADIDNPSTAFLNVSLGVTFDDINGGVQAVTELLITSFDATTIVQLRAMANGTLLFNVGGGNFLVLRNDITTGVFYEFDLFIDYNIDAVVFRYSVDGILIEVFHLPLMDVNKFGIKMVRFEQLNQIAVLNAWRLDYIGIYVNGSSISDEQGIGLIDLNEPTWNFEQNNLVNVTGSGFFSLGVVEERAIPELWLNTSYQVIFEAQVFDESNSSRFFNVYDDFVGVITDPLLMISIVLNGSISHIDVSGVKLVQGVNEHPLIYTHSERTFINLDFFFVDDNNRLQFQMESRFPDDLEFIQANFDIDDLSSDGRALSFRSQINDKAIGNFRVNFTTISNIVQLPIFDTTTRFVLTQNKTIRNFIILVSDNSDPSITGLTEGFVSEIELFFSANIGVSIISTALIDMMIPLIIILIPTLAIAKVAGKISIIPLFFLFSLICVMTLIIPVWLFFIIAISTGVFASMGRSEGVL